jgi:hypothetical protein
MKLIIDVPLVESTDLDGIQAAVQKVTCWVKWQHQRREHSARVISVKKYTEPTSNIRDLAEIENLRQQLDYERYHSASGSRRVG